MTPGVALLLGMLCAGLGGELFVRGAVGLGHWARIPPGIIGATVAAFATSSPELSVAVQSALAGTPQIALGDALGSNGLLGLVLLVAAGFFIVVSAEGLARSFGVPDDLVGPPLWPWAHPCQSWPRR